MRYYLLAVILFWSFGASGQTQDKRLFIFGHSLLDHRPPLNPTPSDETTVPHWMFLLAEASGHEFAAGGQYGFLAQHANLPPLSQWGYDVVPGVWESDTESFAEAQINAVMLTAGNFIQYRAATLPYEDPNNTAMVSPVSATEAIVDWLGDNTTDATIYIYENWPDMAGVLGDGSYPPNQEDLGKYNSNTLGDFHDWWIEYQDQLLESRPNDNVRMIPAGPVIAELLQDCLSDIPATLLYEDDAPHGTPNIYFLAGLVSYMSVFEEKPAADYEISELVDSRISSKYEQIVDIIWTYLLEFKDEDGVSRVFNNELSSAKEEDQLVNLVYPNPVYDELFFRDNQVRRHLKIYSMQGRKLMDLTNEETTSVNVKSLPPGAYLLEYVTAKNLRDRFVKFIKL